MDYSERIATLNREIDKLESTQKIHSFIDNVKCVPKFMIYSLLVPVGFFAILFFLQPWFVKTSVAGEKKRSTAKVMMWTIFLTFISWAGIYIYFSSKGWTPDSMVCAL